MARSESNSGKRPARAFTGSQGRQWPGGYARAVATHVPPRPTVSPPARRLAGGRHEPLLVAALFLGAALISGFTMLRGIDQFDEGLMLQAARRVGDGQLPYRDFLWSYGPGHPYLLALLHEITGVSLLDWRVLARARRRRCGGVRVPPGTEGGGRRARRR